MSTNTDTIADELRKLAEEAERSEIADAGQPGAPNPQTPPSDQSQQPPQQPTQPDSTAVEQILIRQVSERVATDVTARLLKESDGSPEAKQAIDEMAKNLRDNVMSGKIEDANAIATPEVIDNIITTGIGQLVRKNLHKKAELPNQSTTTTATAGSSGVIESIAIKYGKTTAQVKRAAKELADIMGKNLTVEQLDEAIKRL